MRKLGSHAAGWGSWVPRTGLALPQLVAALGTVGRMFLWWWLLVLWVRSCPEELDGQKDTLWLGLEFSPVFLTAPLGWAEVLARIYVFYYACYFFHRSNKSVLWETPSGSIWSTEIGFSHLCSPEHRCPEHQIRVHRCQWCTVCILRTGRSAQLGLSSATLLLSK